MSPKELFFSRLPAELTTNTSVERRLLAEYGAMFVAQGVAVPTKVVFRNQAELDAFHNSLEIAAESIGGLRMELQAPAMAALRRAIQDAGTRGLSITPRGADSARRSYDETVGLWASRVEPALDHWSARGRITDEVAAGIRAAAPFDQVADVLRLEEQGIYFAKDLSKSILYSVAPPGASQHLAMLAFDVSEFDDPQVRAILAEHYWHQTVVSDLPHFTYLGVSETVLPSLGLKRIESGGRQFWLPDI